VDGKYPAVPPTPAFVSAGPPTTTGCSTRRGGGGGQLLKIPYVVQVSPGRRIDRHFSHLFVGPRESRTFTLVFFLPVFIIGLNFVICSVKLVSFPDLSPLRVSCSSRQNFSDHSFEAVASFFDSCIDQSIVWHWLPLWSCRIFSPLQHRNLLLFGTLVPCLASSFTPPVFLGQPPAVIVFSLEARGHS
jgi:hypothetical protein